MVRGPTEWDALAARRYAVVISSVYGAVGAIYIVLSTALAASGSTDVASMLAVELAKGLGFIAVTGLGLFFASRHVLKRMGRLTRANAEQAVAFLEADRRATAGLFAASVAHDLNNALTVFDGNLFALRGDLAAAEREEVFDELETALSHAAELVHRLSVSGAGSAAGTSERCDVGAVVARSMRSLRTHARTRGCEVELVVAGEVVAEVFTALVHQVVANLVLNAIEAGAKRARVRVVAAERGVELEVHDDGPGIPDAVKDKLFDPFFTTKEGGLGLGLVSVRLCAELHAGRVEVGPSELGGACLRVVFARPAPPPPTVRRRRRVKVATGGATATPGGADG